MNNPDISSPDFDYLSWCRANGLDLKQALLLARCWYLQAKTEQIRQLGLSAQEEARQSLEA